MKTVVMLTMLGLVVVQSAKDQSKYTTQYDNVDLQDIMKSERLFKSYEDCILDKGPCTPDGKELREHIPEALQTECSKCNEKQKEGVKTMVVFLIKKRPHVWEALKKKFDPDQKYEQLYAHYLKEAETATF